VFILQVEDLAVVGVRDDELGVGEHVLGVRHLLQTQTVDGLDVGNGEHLVALHDIQADTGNAAVGLVVDEQVLAVVLAVGHGDVRVVAVAVQELGAFAHDRAAFVGQAPAACRVDVKHRDTHDFAHGRYAQDTHFTLVAAGPEAVVVIQLAWANVDFLLGFLDRLGPGLTSHYRTAERGGGHRCTGHGAGTEEAA